MAAHALEILAVVEGGRVDLFIATSWRRSSARVHDRIRCTYLVVQYLEKKLGNLNPTSVLCFFFKFFFSVMTELTEQRTGAPTVAEFSHATGRPTARGGGARASSWGGARREKHPFGDRGT